MTYVDKYQEHTAHSFECSSRWDGFDKGTTWDDEPETETKYIGRMTSEAGYKVEIMETSFRDSGDIYHSVYVNGKELFGEFDSKVKAIRYARWWMDGCPA